MTEIVNTVDNWLLVRKNFKGSTSLGFVPTMGSLHAGHKSLLQLSKKENKLTVLSLFVNPTQFNDCNDFKNYPRSIDEDIILATNCGVDYIFIPSYTELYPDDFTYKITYIATSKHQETLFRVGHFDGVLTVIIKLLLLIKPTRSYFGEKDYQQLQLIKGLVKAFFLETKIVECAVIRNEFGLPLSSRNKRLTREQLQLAKYFSKVFHSPMSCDQIKKALTQKGIDVNYIEDYKGRRFIAVQIGSTRLIDNIPLSTEK
ncbi:pantoate--beta-alanine ligase [Coxiella endosymbiont of Amblyomma americanum]|uniref:pantoate--beta-alanine ligase n=1 Tax=Coxiella endosymbiont of Amblyomma americanum TaxID=325775 RepID=UPI0005805DD6|nr:pantoate--beta-alanine ligase [Coxiella endosymbiont of Amblyomma americanum]AJC50488.1 pantothenate synthetase [Coxiella endosymbiont of Amblyomma americanum]AUJ58826.1 pantothenate synthetase [Coxiella-like endosymbiont of Amblyomma americanum]